MFLHKEMSGSVIEHVMNGVVIPVALHYFVGECMGFL